jgi:hypothetical protein
MSVPKYCNSKTPLGPTSNAQGKLQLMFQILKYLSIPLSHGEPWHLSLCGFYLSPAIVGVPTFNASVVAPCHIDLLTPNSAHKSMVTGIIPILFCWIYSSLSTKASSKSVARAGFPSFLRNMKPEITPVVSFSFNKRSAYSLIRNPDPVTAATGRKC